MNYYKRHIGDYAKKAGHLSPLEHGVYTLLLDAYYDREQAPTRAEAMRVSRARSPEEIAALDYVLAEFFDEHDGRFMQSRVEEEFEKARVVAERNQANGKRGGRPREPKGSQKETQSVSSGLNLGTQNKGNPLIHQSTTTAETKATVQPSAAQSRFGEFWLVYPNKKGRKDAERHWKREGCDPLADQIIAHVHLMRVQDDGWRRGYVPMGSTYVNGRRWEDRPTGPPQSHSSEPSKGMKAILNLEAMKSDGLAQTRNCNGFAETGFPLAGPQSGNGLVAWDSGGMDGDFDPESSLG